MRKKVIIVCLTLTFILMTGIGLYLLSLPEGIDKTKQTSDLETKLGRKLKEIEEKDRLGNLVDYKGKYFELKFPENAELDNKPDSDRTQLTDTYIEYFAFQMLSPRVFYLVQIHKSSDPLESQSAVKVRRLQTDLYKEATPSGFDGLVFTKEEEGGEKAGFMKKGDIFYSFVSTSSSLNEAEKLFDEIAPTITLKP